MFNTTFGRLDSYSITRTAISCLLLVHVIANTSLSQPIKLADLGYYETSFLLSERLVLIGSSVITKTGKLLITDGTSSGTQSVQIPSYAQNFQKIGEALYFFSYDTITDYHSLNKLEGGTWKVTNLGQVNKFNQKNIIRHVTIKDDALFFIAMDENNTPWLWQSNGTKESTQRLPVSFSFLSGKVEAITKLSTINNKILVAGSFSELWATNGIEPFVRIKAASKKDFTNAYFGEYITLNNYSYFKAYDSLHGEEIWRTNGTSEGTELFTDLSPGFWSYDPTLAISSTPENFTRVGNLIYFTTDYGYRLWRTDGTIQGTVKLKTCDKSYCFYNLSSFKNNLIFSFDDLTTGREPWISDGTINGTKLIKDIWPGMASSINSDGSYYPFSTSKEYWFFPAFDGSKGKDLWLVDSLSNAKKIVNSITDQSLTSIISISEINDKIVYVAGNYSYDFKLFSIDKKNSSLIDTSPPPRLPSNYWFQTIGPSNDNRSTINSVFNYDMSIGPKNDIYLAGVQNGQRLNFYDNFFSTPTRYSPRAFLTKINSQGTLKWVKELQTTEMFFQKHSALTTDADGSVYYATTFYPGPYSSSFFDIIPSNKNVNAYLVKFDEEGNEKWFSGGYANQTIEVSNLKVDADGNIIMTGLYFGFSFQWGNSHLTSNESPTYFIQKLDSNGNSIWAKNISTGWKDYGNISDMEIDYLNKRVVVLISEGGRNVWSSCEFQRWPVQLLAFDLEGTLIWRKDFDCSDLMMANSLAVGPNGDILVVGRYRGNLNWDGQSVQSEKNDGCSINTSFLARVDKDANLKNLSTDNPNNIEPFEVQFFKNGNYLISGIEKHKQESRYDGFGVPYPSGTTQLFIRQYDYGGTLLSERKFNKYASEQEDSNPIMRIDNNSDLIFSDRYKGKFDSLSYSITENYNNNLAIMKIKLAQFPNKVDPAIALEGIQIFPNPTSERAYLKIWRDQFISQDFSVQVIDLVGHVVYENNKLPQTDAFAIDTSNLSPGLYLFKVCNAASCITKKLLVYH